MSTSDSKSGSSVKPEPLDQMALYSSHFGKAPPSAVSAHPAVLSGMSQHAEAAATSSMLTGLPHLTPAPFNTHSMHSGGFSDDIMKYHNTHQIHHPHHHHHQPDYTSFAASAAAASSMTSGHLGSFSTYPGLASASEHSNHHHHHHAKLNLQTT